MNIEETTTDEIEAQLKTRREVAEKVVGQFLACDLSILAYANNFTQWHYTTVGGDITIDGYFNKAVGMLRVGDLIIANTDAEGAIATAFYYVMLNDGFAVEITQM